MATNNNTNGPTATNGLTASGRIISTIAVTKGDIIAGTGSSTSSTLTPGNPFQVIVANSANATGLDWANGNSSSNDNNLIFGYGNSLSNYTKAINQATTAAGTALVANTIYCMPFNINISTTFTAIGVQVSSGVAATNIRLGIYDCYNTGGLPGDLVLDAGTIDSSSIGEKTISISQVLHGKYWLCLISNGAPSILGASSSSGINSNLFWGMNQVTNTNQSSICSQASVSSYYSALPSTFVGITGPSRATSPTTYAIFLKV